MIDNLRVTMVTTGGQTKRFDIKPEAARALADAIYRELDGRIERVVRQLISPVPKREKRVKA